MALIKCLECQREVSDKANRCPHCGYPIAVRSSVAVEPERGANKAAAPVPEPQHDRSPGPSSSTIGQRESPSGAAPPAQRDLDPQEKDQPQAIVNNGPAGREKLFLSTKESLEGELYRNPLFWCMSLAYSLSFFGALPLFCWGIAEGSAGAVIGAVFAMVFAHLFRRILEGLQFRPILRGADVILGKDSPSLLEIDAYIRLVGDEYVTKGWFGRATWRANACDTLARLIEKRLALGEHTPEFLGACATLVERVRPRWRDEHLAALLDGISQKIVALSLAGPPERVESEKHNSSGGHV